MRVYVASSWRTPRHAEVVLRLQEDGHYVYDYRDHGFSWSDIDPDWEGWTTHQYVAALKHPLAETGFGRDIGALNSCGGLMLVSPAGASAHLELGYAIGRGKSTVILIEEGQRADLMYKAADVITDNLEIGVRYFKGQDMRNPSWES